MYRENGTLRSTLHYRKCTLLFLYSVPLYNHQINNFYQKVGQKILSVFWSNSFISVDGDTERKMLCHSLSLQSCDPSLSLTFTAICSHFNSTLEIKEIYCFTVNRTLNSHHNTSVATSIGIQRYISIIENRK